MFERNPHHPSAFPRDALSRLVFEFSKLPGIGEKSATRLAYHVLKQDPAYARGLADALVAARDKIQLCSTCFGFTESDPCRICSQPDRDPGIICVVERPTDAHTIDQSGTFRGRFHVLHGVLSPLDGVGPDDLKIRELVQKIQTLRAVDPAQAREVLVATNPSTEGEATAHYIGQLLRPFGVKVTQLAAGLPVGGMLQYSDRQTISRAIQNRMELRG
ncbi:MAG: recombination mediator RecR [Bdellovibrionota bacterium]